MLVFMLGICVCISVDMSKELLNTKYINVTNEFLNYIKKRVNNGRRGIDSPSDRCL